MDRSARPASRGLRLTLAVAVLAWCLAAQPRPAAGQEMQMSKSPLKGTGGGTGAAADTAAAGGGAATNDTAASQRFETYQHYFALCAVTKDRPGDLREWVDYHHALGVTKFYVFDTDQRVPNGPILQDYIDNGTVEYYHLPRVTPRTIPLMQVRLYYLCLKHLSDKHHWLGFWDVDEFLVLTNPSVRFPGMLREYENYGGVVVNWRLVGSSGHLTRPAGGVIRNFLKCTPEDYHENHQVKSIVNTQFAHLPTTDPHHFAYKEGKYAVNTAFEKVDGAVNVAIRNDKLTLFHYALKSAAEYQEKMRKGSAMGNYKNMLFFQRIDEAAALDCRQALEACRGWGVPWCSDNPAVAAAAGGRSLPWRPAAQAAGAAEGAQVALGLEAAGAAAGGQGGGVAAQEAQGANAGLPAEQQQQAQAAASIGGQGAATNSEAAQQQANAAAAAAGVATAHLQLPEQQQQRQGAGGGSEASAAQLAGVGGSGAAAAAKEQAASAATQTAAAQQAGVTVGAGQITTGAASATELAGVGDAAAGVQQQQQASNGATTGGGGVAAGGSAAAAAAGVAAGSATAVGQQIADAAAAAAQQAGVGTQQAQQAAGAVAVS